MEKAIGEELNQTATVIKKTGIFTNIDKLYGEEEATETPETGGEEAALGGDVSVPGEDLGGDSPIEEPADAGGGDAPADLELASIDKSKLPLILEKLNNNNNFNINTGKKELEDVSEKLDSLLKD